MTLKERIIKEAFKLFSEKGYEKTTISELINVVGTSKGGFYHHFKSKNEILEEITLSYLSGINNFYAEMLEDEEFDILEKFTSPLYFISKTKLNAVSTWPKLSKMYDFESSHIIIKKLADSFEKSTENYYYNLILLGIKEKVFKTSSPKETAALWAREVINIQRLAKKLFFEENEEKYFEYKSMLEFNENLINYLLNLESKKIEIVKYGLDYVKSINEAIHKGVDNND